MDYLQHLAQIAYAVMGPIVLLVGAGYLVGRRVPAAAEVLAKVLLYFLIPVFVFQNILSSSLGAAECGTIVLFSTLVLAVLYGVARHLERRAPPRPAAARGVRQHHHPLQQRQLRPAGHGPGVRRHERPETTPTP